MHLSELPENWHFFSTSVAYWRNGVDLEEQICFHKKQGYTFLIYLVPCAVDTPYEVLEYAPQVSGSFIIAKYVVEEGPLKAGVRKRTWTITTHRNKQPRGKDDD
jgi:formylmethanofuran dehydrogenase subunit E-like metal-binding protein